MNVKGIKVSENLSAEKKSNRLSAHLPRCAPCRAFRKEVLKGETAEAQLNKASKNNINFNAERQFIVSAEFTKAAPEGNGSFPRQKMGALFTLALVCAKVKALAA